MSKGSKEQYRMCLEKMLFRFCIPLDKYTVNHIRLYLESRNDTNEALFVSNRAPHNRLSTSAIRKILHSLQEKSGIDNIIPHKFRHTMATHAINSGMPIESIQSLLGHSNIETTLRYAHVSNSKIEADYKKYMK